MIGMVPQMPLMCKMVEAAIRESMYFKYENNQIKKTNAHMGSILTNKEKKFYKFVKVIIKKYKKQLKEQTKKTKKNVCVD